MPHILSFGHSKAAKNPPEKSTPPFPGGASSQTYKSWGSGSWRVETGHRCSHGWKGSHFVSSSVAYFTWVTWSCRSLWYGATCLQQVEYWRCFNKMFQVGLMFMMIWNGLYEFVKEVMWKRISNSLHHRIPWCRALLFHRETFKYTKTLSGLQKHPRRTLQNCQMEIEKLKKQLHVVDAWSEREEVVWMVAWVVCMWRSIPPNFEVGVFAVWGEFDLGVT